MYQCLFSFLLSFLLDFGTSSEVLLSSQNCQSKVEEVNTKRKLFSFSLKKTFREVYETSPVNINGSFLTIPLFFPFLFFFLSWRIRTKCFRVFTKTRKQLKCLQIRPPVMSNIDISLSLRIVRSFYHTVSVCLYCERGV